MIKRKNKKTGAVLAFFLIAPLSSINAANYNYAEALQKSIFFYDVQRLGKISAETGNMSNRVYWRGDSFLQDYALPNEEGAIDLGGGFADAGDNPKFNFPMASSMTLLAWGVIEFGDTYTKTGQLTPLLANLRWGMDYLLKCWDAKNERLYGQVSPDSVQAAHSNLWMPYEVTDQASIDKTLPRYAFYVDATHPGTDLAGETVAALTAASIAFQTVDSAYATKLLTAAKEIYTNLVNVDKKGKYSENMGRLSSGTWKLADVSSFYNSWSGYRDEVAWASMWLYRATGDTNYVTVAEQYINFGNTVATLSWDDKSYGTYLLMAKFLPDTNPNKAKALQSAKGWLDAWSKGDSNHKFSTDGLAISSVLAPWGNARYAATTSFAAEIYDQYFATNTYDAFAKGQIDYLLGNNSKSFSYLCGFGANFPKQPHHATAQGRWSGNNDVNHPDDNRHILYGGLVGGPKDTSDTYTDDRGDYIGNEVALDYNAGFVGALAALTGEYGGTPLSNDQFPPTAQLEQPPSDEIFVNGRVQSKQQGSQQSVIQVSLLATNHSAWPARVTKNLKIRYFINLSDKPTSAALPSVKTYNTDSRAVVNGPALYDSSNGIYYVEVWFKDIPIYPGGDERQISSKETQIQITYPWSHDFSLDWSYSGLSTSSQYKETPNVPIYLVNDDGTSTLLFGNEPQNVVQDALTLNFGTTPAQCLGLNDTLVLSSGQSTGFTISNTPFTYTTAVGGPFTVNLASTANPIVTTDGGTCSGELNAVSVNIPGSLTASYTYAAPVPVTTGTLQLSPSNDSDSRCNLASDNLYLDGNTTAIGFIGGIGVSKSINTGTHTLKLASESSIAAGGEQTGKCTGLLSANTVTISKDTTTPVKVTYTYKDTTPGMSCQVTSSTVTQQSDWGMPSLVNSFDIKVKLTGFPSNGGKISLQGSFTMANPLIQNFWGNFSLTPSFNGSSGSFTGEVWSDSFTLGGFISNESPLSVGSNPLLSMSLNGVICN